MNLRMPGQYYDAESGNFYNWNRYYKPSIGRYLSPDPIGQDGGINLFDYVDQNPVMASDPSGEFAQVLGGAVIAAPIGIVACYYTPGCRQAMAQTGQDIAQSYCGVPGRVFGGMTQIFCSKPSNPDNEKDNVIPFPKVKRPICTSGNQEDPEDLEGRDNRCEENLERDLATCRGMGRRDGKSAYKICEQQAYLRYSNCLSGRDKDIDAPIPPMGTR